MLGIIGIAGLLLPGRRIQVLKVGLSAIGIAAVLAPWLYVVIIYRDEFAVTKSISTAFRVTGFFPQSLDNVWCRLSPLPLDSRSLAAGVLDVDTPYLDAQVSVPLIAVLSLVLVLPLSNWRKRQPILTDAVGWLALAMAILAFFVSVHPSISVWFGGLFDMLQICH